MRTVFSITLEGKILQNILEKLCKLEIRNLSESRLWTDVLNERRSALSAIISGKPRGTIKRRNLCVLFELEEKMYEVRQKTTRTLNGDHSVGDERREMDSLIEKAVVKAAKTGGLEMSAEKREKARMMGRWETRRHEKARRDTRGVTNEKRDKNEYRRRWDEMLANICGCVQLPLHIGTDSH